MTINPSKPAGTKRNPAEAAIGGLLLLFLAALAIAFLYGNPIALAKDYHFSDVRINVYVQPDGSFDFVEDRTFDFSGDYSWAEYKLYLQGAKEITDFDVLEGETAFRKDFVEEPGNVHITMYSDYLYAKWFYRASNEKRTFTIRYKAVEGIKVYADTAQLYWKFIGSESPEPTDQVSVRVHLPKGVSKDEIKAWGHGPLHGNIDIVDGETVNYEISNLPANTFVEGRIVFPTSLVPAAPNRSPNKMLPAILSEEKELADTANRERLVSRIGNIIGVVLPLVSLMLGFVIWLVFGKEYRSEFEGDYYRELPSDYEPAIAGYLWNFGNVTMNDMVATIMDLARRGFLKIKEVQKEKSGFFGTKTVYDYWIEQLPKKQFELKDFERDLVDYLFGTIGSAGGTANSVSMHQIEEYAKGHTSSFQSFVSNWQGHVKEQSLVHGFIDKTSTYLMYANIVLGVAVAALGVFLISVEIITGVVCIILGVIQASLSSLIKRRSKLGALQFQQWAAFRRFLLHFSNLKEAIPSSMEIWEHYLVYAVTLGVAAEVIRQLKIVLPQMNQGVYYGPAWFESGRGMSGLSSLDSLSSSFSSMVSTATSAMSSSSGGGGGFSGGGGGGGGGGGAGAG